MKKTFNINHYEAVFNDENLTCGLTINLDEYEIPVSSDEEWKFSVDFKEHFIKVSSNSCDIFFEKADEDLLIRVTKTDQLPILYGRSKTLQIDGAIVADPEFL